MQTQSDHRDVHQGCGYKRNQAVRLIRQPLKATLKVQIIPTIQGRARDARHVECLFCWQMLAFNGTNDIKFFRCGISHSSNSTSPIIHCLRRRFSKVRSATHSFSAEASERNSLSSGTVVCRAVSPESCHLPTSGNFFDRL